MKRVKLVTYQDEGTKTYIDTFTANEFSDFILVPIPTERVNDREWIEEMQGALSVIQTSKQFIIVSDELNFTFYGLKEEDDDSGPSNCELQHEGSVDPVVGDTEL